MEGGDCSRGKGRESGVLLGTHLGIPFVECLSSFDFLASICRHNVYDEYGLSTDLHASATSIPGFVHNTLSLIFCILSFREIIGNLLNRP